MKLPWEGSSPDLVLWTAVKEVDFRTLLWDKGDSLPRTWVQKGSHMQKLIKAAQRGALLAKEGNKIFRSILRPQIKKKKS